MVGSIARAGAIHALMLVVVLMMLPYVAVKVYRGIWAVQTVVALESCICKRELELCEKW